MGRGRRDISYFAGAPSPRRVGLRADDAHCPTKQTIMLNTHGALPEPFERALVNRSELVIDQLSDARNTPLAD